MTKQDENWEVVKRFAQVAERFCTLVDSMATVERTEFLLQIYRLLPELIGEAIRLPLIESEDDGSDDQDIAPDISPEEMVKKLLADAQLHNRQEWKPLYEALNEKLGDWNLYWKVFDPTDGDDHEALSGTLGDDLAGIYCDLKDGIRLVQSRQTSAEDVISGWQNGFHIHWGRHAMDALKAIHVRLEDELTGFNRPD